MPGLSGAGAFGIALEATKGTWTAPTVWIPVLSEGFRYVENRYFSPQIREESMFSDVKQGYYHIEGDMEMEADARFLPYLLHAAPHTIGKTGTGPWEYTFVPSGAGSTSTGAGNIQKTLAITIIRNAQVFRYSGCTCGSLRFFIDEGILKFGTNLFGEEEVAAGAPGAPSWVASSLYGADASAIFSDAAGATPAFATQEMGFEGFTWEANFNPTAENRIIRERSANYIAFHQTEISLDTTLDFENRTEYDNFVATTQKAFRLESLNGGVSFAAATDAVRVDTNRVVYETYDLGLSGLADIIKAGVTGQGIALASGDAYKLWVKSPINIT